MVPLVEGRPHRPHLVELHGAEDVDPLGEQLVDVAQQVGVHRSAEDQSESRAVTPPPDRRPLIGLRLQLLWVSYAEFHWLESNTNNMSRGTVQTSSAVNQLCLNQLL